MCRQTALVLRSASQLRKRPLGTADLCKLTYRTYSTEAVISPNKLYLLVRIYVVGIGDMCFYGFYLPFSQGTGSVFPFGGSHKPLFCPFSPCTARAKC